MQIAFMALPDQAMAKRLVRAREQAGYEKAADGARAVGVKEETYWGHENGNRGFKAKAPCMPAASRSASNGS